MKSRLGKSIVALVLLSCGLIIIVTMANQKSLTEACASGDLEVVKARLGKGENVNSVDEYGQPCLYLAVRYGHLVVAEFLILNGADANIRTTMGLTALHSAASNGDVEAVRLLLKHGGDATAIENHGQSVLFWTTGPCNGCPGYKGENAKVAEILIANGANVSFRTKAGNSPLGNALGNDMAEVTDVLRRFGAVE